MHALTHAMLLTPLTRFNTLAPLIHFTTHTGTFTPGVQVNSRVPGISTLPPQTLHGPLHIMHPLDLARPDRTHLIAICFKGAYSLPLFLKEAILLLAPGLDTFYQLNPIVPP